MQMLLEFDIIPVTLYTVVVSNVEFWHVQDRYQHSLQTHVHPEMPLDQGIVAALHSAKV